MIKYNTADVSLDVDGVDYTFNVSSPDPDQFLAAIKELVDVVESVLK